MIDPWIWYTLGLFALAVAMVAGVFIWDRRNYRKTIKEIWEREGER